MADPTPVVSLLTYRPGDVLPRSPGWVAVGVLAVVVALTSVGFDALLAAVGVARAIHARSDPVPPTPIVAAPVFTRPLTAPEAAAVIGSFPPFTPPLTPAQAATLTQRLRAATRQRTSPVTAGPPFGVMLHDGTLLLFGSTPAGRLDQLMIAADGRVTQPSVPSDLAPVPDPTARRPAGPGVRIVAGVLLAATSLVNGLLGLALAVVGVLILRARGAADRWATWWVSAKLLAVAAGTAAVLGLFCTENRAIRLWSPDVGVPLAVGLAAASFPIALHGVLRRRAAAVWAATAQAMAGGESQHGSQVARQGRPVD